MNFIGFVKNITEPARPYGGNCYYGLNVSGQQRYEPLDQIDGFIVAKALQQQYGGEFYPYIAGVYGVFNTTKPNKARKAQRMLVRREIEKKQLLESLLDGFGLSGRVITTYEIWDDPDYWQIFKEIAPPLVSEEENGYLFMKFKDFPKDILGAYDSVIENGAFNDLPSCNMYVPAEVAEAIYMKKKYGVDWKLGPLAEELYDQYIRPYGVGIIQFRQPMAKKEDGSIIEVCPYIGKESEWWDRIFIYDDVDALSRKCTEDNPSYLEAKRLSQICTALGFNLKEILGSRLNTPINTSAK